MKINVKEVLWFLVPFVMALLLIASWGGFTDDTIDINIHDTYYVIAPLHLFILLVPVFGFFTFVFRSAAFRFNNTASNISLSVFTLLFALEVILLVYGFSNIKS